MLIYYVYTLARPDETVFYVGKGSGKRIDQHEPEARTGKKSYKCNIIRKVWANGGQIIKTKILETIDEQEAFRVERETIELYGRENLANRTDGGEGTSGRICSPESKMKMSKTMKGRKQKHVRSDEQKRKQSETTKGKSRPPFSDEWRKRQSESAKNRKTTPGIVARAMEKRLKTIREGRMEWKFNTSKKSWATRRLRDIKKSGQLNLFEETQ